MNIIDNKYNKLENYAIGIIENGKIKIKKIKNMYTGYIKYKK